MYVNVPSSSYQCSVTLQMRLSRVIHLSDHRQILRVFPHVSKYMGSPFNSICDVFSSYLLRLPLEELRKPPCRQIADMMWGLRKDNAWPHATFDQEGLDLAHKFFSCSSYLTLRLIGIQEINCYITTFNEFVNDLDPRVGAQLGTHFAKWILEKLIVEEIFGQNAHVELISRSVQIINFLSQHQCLSMEQLDCIWNAAQVIH